MSVQSQAGRGHETHPPGSLSLQTGQWQGRPGQQGTAWGNQGFNKPLFSLEIMKPKQNRIMCFSRNTKFHRNDNLSSSPKHRKEPSPRLVQRTVGRGPVCGQSCHIPSPLHGLTRPGLSGDRSPGLFKATSTLRRPRQQAGPQPGVPHLSHPRLSWACHPLCCRRCFPTTGE